MNIQKLTLLLLCLTTSVGLPLYANPKTIVQKLLLDADQRKPLLDPSDNDVLGSEKTQPLTNKDLNIQGLGSEKTQLLPKSAQGYGSTDDFSSDEEILTITPPKRKSVDSNKSTKSNPLPKASQYPMLPSQEIRPDITLFMRKAYEGNWQYFKDLANGNLSLSEKLKNLIYLKNLTATDNNGRTVLHWALKSPKGPEKALTFYWLTTYLTKQISADAFKEFVLKKNKNDDDDKTFIDKLVDLYIQKPFNPEDPSTDLLPSIYYSLYDNGVHDLRIFQDALAWAIARNKTDVVYNLITYSEAKHQLDFTKNALTGKHPFEYIKTKEMRKTLKPLISWYSIM